MKTKEIERRALVLALVGIVIGAAPASAQGTPEQRSAIAIAAQYRILPNVVYGVADNFETKVDLYLPRGRPGPVPTLIQIHGGGWVGGTKEGNSLRLLPWLEMGWAVVNVQYRLGQVALAPAAVEDCLCALRWVIGNAEEYGFDPQRIVVTGYSAGGHLALTTGIMAASAGLDRRCPGSESLEVAAIVNWYGITDVNDLLEGANTRSYAVQWLGSLPDRHDVARRVSPLTHVRGGLPPVLTIHGDADPVVPYTHAVRLRDALSRAGVPNALHTVPGGGHGNFSVEEYQQVYETVRQFLKEHVTE